MAPHSNIVVWKIPRVEEPGRLQSVGVVKSQTRLSDFPFTFHFHALEKEMATHSSALVWRIPGTEEPGGLPSRGSHGVRHDWSALAAAAPVWTTATTSHGFHPYLDPQTCSTVVWIYTTSIPNCQYPKLPYQPLPTITVRRALLCRNIWGLTEEDSFSFSTLKSTNRLCFGLEVDRAVRFSTSTFLKKDSWRITVINSLVFFFQLNTLLCSNSIL